MKTRQNDRWFLSSLLCFAVLLGLSAQVLATEWQLKPDADYIDRTPVYSLQAQAHGMWTKPEYKNDQVSVTEPGEQKPFYIDGNPVRTQSDSRSTLPTTVAYPPCVSRDSFSTPRIALRSFVANRSILYICLH